MIVVISVVMLFSLLLDAFNFFHSRNANFIILLCISMSGLLYYEDMWSWAGVFVGSNALESIIFSSIRDTQDDV